MPRDFINSFIAPERMVRPGLGTCHSAQFSGTKIAKSITSHSMPYGTCHWHVVRVLILSLVVPERLNRFGPGRFCLARNDDRNAIWSIAISFVTRDMCLRHVARDLTKLLFADEWLICFRPDRRRSTQANTGNVVLPMPGCSRKDTWHAPLARAKQLDEIASITQPGSQIEAEKAVPIRFVFTSEGGTLYTFGLHVQPQVQKVQPQCMQVQPQLGEDHFLD